MNQRNLRTDRRTFFASLFFVLFAIGAIGGLLVATAIAEEESKQPEQPPREPEAKTVSMVIDYSDGVEMRFVNIPWREGLNIGDLMKYASEHRHGIALKVRGKGATSLLYRIDDLENQGGKGLNWIFKVNEKLGDRSFAITTLAPGDQVLWKFDEYR